MGTSTVPTLQLDLPKFESLTAGTNLPQVPLEEIEMPPPPAPPPISGMTESEKSQAADLSSMSPPQSPGRPTSMRRFLSRVSLNGSYNHADDKASIFSTPTLSSPDVKRKKTSWWKKGSSKRYSMMPSASENERKVQSIPPPPRLPDDMFGTNLPTLDGDMFKNFK